MGKVTSRTVLDLQDEQSAALNQQNDREAASKASAYQAALDGLTTAIVNSTGKNSWKDTQLTLTAQTVKASIVRAKDNHLIDIGDATTRLNALTLLVSKPTSEGVTSLIESRKTLAPNSELSRNLWTFIKVAAITTLLVAAAAVAVSTMGLGLPISAGLVYAALAVGGVVGLGSGYSAASRENASQRAKDLDLLTSVRSNTLVMQQQPDTTTLLNVGGLLPAAPSQSTEVPQALAATDENDHTHRN